MSSNNGPSDGDKRENLRKSLNRVRRNVSTFFAGHPNRQDHYKNLILAYCNVINRGPFHKDFKAFAASVKQDALGGKGKQFLRFISRSKKLKNFDRMWTSIASSFGIIAQIYRDPELTSVVQAIADNLAADMNQVDIALVDTDSTNPPSPPDSRNSGDSKKTPPPPGGGSMGAIYAVV